MPTSCLVPGCKTGYNSYKGPKYRHVSLPKSPKLLEIWLSKIKRIDYSSSRGKICMKHFREDDLIPEHENLGCRGKPKKQRRLKPNAIPSLCLTEDNSDNCEPKPKKIRKSQKFQNLADLEEFSYETVDGITENPWDVSDPSVFLKYCCPECDYSEQNLGIFSDHALKNHVNSIILFKMKPSDFVKCEIIEENLTDETLYNDYEEVIIPQNSEDFKLESQDLVDIKEEVLEKYEDLEENISNIKLKELKSENVIEENEDFRLSTSLKPKHSEKYYIDRSRIAAFIINRVNIKNYDLGNSYKYFQNGFWFCDECNENKKFLFLFELFQHWRDNHDSDFIIEMNTDLEVKLQEMCQSNLDILSDCNELIPQRNYWKCEVCQNGVKFDHKFQLVSHWYENHSNKNVTYEACQLCMDLFTSPEHREKHHLIFHPAASSFEYRCYLHPLYYKGPKEKICTVSARIFYNLRALKNHYKKNHEKEFGREFELPFNCDSCDKSFILGEALLFHQKSEHGHQIKTLKCEYCPRTFFSKATKAIHENIHSKAQKIQTFTCKVCLDGVATSAKEIIEHHTDLHEGYALPFFECDICDFYSDQKKQTKDHLKSEHNIDEYKPYKCRQCNFKAFNYAELIRHIQGHTTELKFICEICNKALKTANTLRIHKKINHVEKVKENVCDICGYVGTKASLTRHMTEIHKKDKKCPYCEKNFGKKDALEYHLDNHHPGTSEIQHTCQECGKGFMFRNTLTRHFHYNHKGIVQTKQKGSSGKWKSVATETISVKCEYCGIDFTNKTIKRHIGASHPEKIDQTEKQEYRCTQCDEKFGASITLLKHEYVEHGILKHPNVCEHCHTPYNKSHTRCSRIRKKQPVSCDICGKYVSSKHKLRLHKINLHGIGKDKKVHKCEFCDKSFGALQLLKGHVNQSHTRETCPHCQKSILNTFFLKKHLVFDHGIKDGALFCDFCPKKVFFFEGYLKKHMKEKHGSPD